MQSGFIIYSKLDTILDSLQHIERRLEKLEKDSSKMSDHINFIQKTYNIVRVPLSYLKNKVEHLMGSHTASELPVIQNNTIEE